MLCSLYSRVEIEFLSRMYKHKTGVAVGKVSEQKVVRSLKSAQCIRETRGSTMATSFHHIQGYLFDPLEYRSSKEIADTITYSEFFSLLIWSVLECRIRTMNSCPLSLENSLILASSFSYKCPIYFCLCALCELSY